MTGMDAEPDPRRWPALWVCLVAGFMTLLDVSIVNVALPSIQSGLGATASELSWVVSGYALTFGLVLVSSGRLGDDRGRTGSGAAAEARRDEHHVRVRERLGDLVVILFGRALADRRIAAGAEAPRDLVADADLVRGV